MGFLGSDPSQVTKRIIALTHLIFNALTLILMLVLLQPVYRGMKQLGLTQDPVVGIAAFHTIYNMIGVLAFSPFVKKYVKYLQRK